MSMWKKAMNYLGLGPDDAYDDYDAPIEGERPPTRQRAAYAEPADATVRTIPPRGAPAREPAPTRGGYEAEPPAVTVRSRQASAVRTVSSTASGKPHTVRPRSFNQAQEVADKFKEGQPVIVNLQEVDKDLSRRIIDFASGLCYGLGGTMEKVASGVYVLTPANATVSAEERQRLAEHPDG
jgi:cell division inhibitor SepF